MVVVAFMSNDGLVRELGVVSTPAASGGVGEPPGTTISVASVTTLGGRTVTQTKRVFGGLVAILGINLCPGESFAGVFGDLSILLNLSGRK